MMIKRFLLIVFAAVSIVNAQTVTPIADLKTNNDQGVPAGLGQTFTVTGIVTAGNNFGNAGPGAVQDETAGISVYGSDFTSKVSIGDSVTVTGKLDQFNGLAQINFTQGGASVIKHSSGHTVEPQAVTIKEIKEQQWNGFEEFEGRLIRINNVTITGSGTFSGGTSGRNYPIADSTGTLEIRIDESVNLNGTAIPGGKVDIIGILSQYDNSAPHSTGYQLMPRDIHDLVSDGSPLILNPVFATDIDTSSFTVYFNTARPGNSQVKYGLTPALELDSVVIEADTTTVHKVKVEGLQSSALYYYQALSRNENGVSESGIYSVHTASGDTTTGTINVYFNFSVDTSIALPGNAAQGNVDFTSKLIDRINSADYSIDMAVYSFSGQPYVANALITAKNRGVKVRVIYDNRTTQNSMQSIINAGIKVVKRNSTDGIMHNKFFVFDGRDGLANNDWVWTGSWNVTSLEVGWKNNVLEINDPAVASAYTAEFEEMWGSSSDEPGTGKFGPLKSDNTPHTFNIKGKDLLLYFSPSDRTTGKIINALNTADNSIYLAQYVFTRNDIEAVIENRFNAGAKDIRGVIYDKNAQGSEFTNLDVYGEMLVSAGATQHHKYSIIDPQYPESSPVVITGSHNWSSAAENVNDENTLIIYDYQTANLYLQEFKKRYNEAGGTGAFIVPVSVEDKNQIQKFAYNLYQNYPNPFNPVTTIRFELPMAQHVELKIYDVLGREVKTLFNGMAPAGIVAVDFNAADLPSGIYVYSIKTDSFSESKKLMLMK